MDNVLKSPFWSIFSVVTITLIVLTNTALDDLPGWAMAAANAVILLCLATLLGWFVSVFRHNRKHPAAKVRWSGFYPVEFREEDEGMRWLTYEACRRVYMFYNVALPIVMIVFFASPGSRVLPVLTVAVLAVAQYGIYWFTIRKANVEEE